MLFEWLLFYTFVAIYTMGIGFSLVRRWTGGAAAPAALSASSPATDPSASPRRYHYTPQQLKQLVRVQALWRGRQARRRYKMAVRRHNIAAEILSSEEKYLEALQNMVEYYLLPMRKLASEQPMSPRQTGLASVFAGITQSELLLSENDIKNIFSHTQVIFNFSQHLTESLRDRLKHWHVEQRIGDVFLSVMDYFHVYSDYCNNYNEALLLLSQREQNKNFAMFIKQCEAKLKQANKNQSLPGYLIQPVQRIPRYVLLLSDLERFTWDGHPDREDVATASQKMAKLADRLDQKHQEADSINEVFRVQNQIEGLQDAINSPYNEVALRSSLSAGRSIRGSNNATTNSESRSRRNSSLVAGSDDKVMNADDSRPTSMSAPNSPALSHHQSAEPTQIFDGNLVVPHRRLSKSGKLKLLTNKGRQAEDVYCFLFNDLFIGTINAQSKFGFAKKEKRYLYQFHFFLAGASLREVAAKRETNVQGDQAYIPVIMIQTSRFRFCFQASSAEEKKEWMDAFQANFDRLVKKRDSFRIAQQVKGSLEGILEAQAALASPRLSPNSAEHDACSSSSSIIPAKRKERDDAERATRRRSMNDESGSRRSSITVATPTITTTVALDETQRIIETKQEED
ncbi:hypothetical protein QOT17_001810 [Balamuthia mandrillaris]